MSDLRVIATVDVDKEKAPKDLGVQKLAYTVNPAIIFMGVSYEAEKPIVPLSKDGKKMRICAPVLVPGEIWRNSLGGHTVIFTPEEIELMMRDFMERYNSQTKYFIHEHNNRAAVGSFILESWLIEDAENDKANTVYKLGLPVGSWVIVTQFVDEDEFNTIVKSGATGLSIEGWLGHKLALSLEQEYADMILIKDGKALTLKRSEGDSFEAGKIGFPGGKIEAGEDPRAAAIRETFEETGILLEDVEEVETVTNEDGTKSHYFKALCNVDPILSGEHTDFEWLEAEEIGENVIKGEKERFKNLIIKAQKMEEAKKVVLQDGEYTDKNGAVFKVKDGVIIAPEEMEKDKPKEGETVEMEAEELEDGGTIETEGALKEGAKTTAPDGVHTTKAGKIVTVTGGVVEKIEDKKPEEKPEPGTVKESSDYLTKEEAAQMIKDVKEEFAKILADLKTEIMQTGKSSDGGEAVEMSAHQVSARKLELLREQMK